MRTRAYSVAACLALSTTVACGGEDPSPAPAAYSAAWVEFMSPAELTGDLSLYAERDLAINVAWHAADLEDPERIALVRDAEATGVRINPWLLLDEADGYWPGATNAALFDAAARELMGVWEDAGLAPTTLLVDMELRFDQAQQLTGFLTAETPDIASVLALFNGNFDAMRFEEARSVYATLADDARAKGWQVALTTLPQMLDDYADGDDDLRQAFGIPIDGIAWDFMTFQAYRTLFGDLLASVSSARPTSYFVFRYAELAVELFGDKGGVDIGLVGAGVTEGSVYTGPEDLAIDIEAARAAGVPKARLQVYNLDGMYERGPAADWMLAEPAETTAPPKDEATEELINTDASLDAVLQPPEMMP